MSGYTSEQIHAAFEWTMKEVHRQYAAGELDMSGRFYTDEELLEGAAEEGRVPDRLKKKPEAAA